MSRCLRVLAAILALVCGLASPGRAAVDRNALWQVISGLCVRGQERAGVPFPCQAVDLKKGVAILGAGGAHFLLVPTARVLGIESPNLIRSDAPNYWEYAWEARHNLDEVTGAEVSRDEIGLAVNSAQARTQDQLHIHIGCIRPDVRAALQVYEADVRETWSKLPFGVAGHRYRIMRIVGDTLGQVNPFDLLARGIPAVRNDMASQTIVVAGAKFRDGRTGFYVLTAADQGRQPASGERLLDYKCSVALAVR